MTEPTDQPGPPEPPPPPPADPRARLRERYDRGFDSGALVWGLILLAVGIWFFLDHTLELDMPSLDWGDIWPIVLILVGGAVIYQAMRRRTG